MRHRDHSAMRLSLAALAMSVLALSGAPRAQTVGSVGAVNQDTKGEAPGGASKTVTLGQSVIHNERIQTGPDGSAQIAFTDTSTMSIGNSSTVVIDDYVYNPAAGAGAQTASLLRGAMRFVGGQVSHGGGATVKTPVATIGVRGGVASISLVMGPGGRFRLQVIGHFGVVTVENSAGKQVIRFPDYAVEVDGPNSAPRFLGLVDPSLLAEIARLTTSHGRQHGGAVHLPTDALMARDGVATPRPGAPTPNSDLMFGGDDVARSEGSTGSGRFFNTCRPPTCAP